MAKESNWATVVCVQQRQRRWRKRGEEEVRGGGGTAKTHMPCHRCFGLIFAVINVVRVLTRVIPILHEDPAWEDFWLTATPVGVKVTLVSLGCLFFRLTQEGGGRKGNARRQAAAQTDTRAHTRKHTDRHTHRQTDRQTDRQTHTHTHTHTHTQ